MVRPIVPPTPIHSNNLGPDKKKSDKVGKLAGQHKVTPEPVVTKQAPPLPAPPAAQKKAAPPLPPMKKVVLESKAANKPALPPLPAAKTAHVAAAVLPKPPVTPKQAPPLPPKPTMVQKELYPQPLVEQFILVEGKLQFREAGSKGQVVASRFLEERDIDPSDLQAFQSTKRAMKEGKLQEALNELAALPPHSRKMFYAMMPEKELSAFFVSATKEPLHRLIKVSLAYEALGEKRFRDDFVPATQKQVRSDREFFEIVSNLQEWTKERAFKALDKLPLQPPRIAVLQFLAKAENNNTARNILYEYASARPELQEFAAKVKAKLMKGHWPA